MRGKGKTKAKLIIWVLSCLAASIVSASPVFQETSRRLLQQGFYQEEVRGDLAAAIRIYREIIDRFPQDKASGAQAQYRIAICYEKRGDSRAGDAFHKVVTDYPRQFQWVALAEEKMKRHPQPEINPQVRYYFERNPPDPMASISYDGLWLAYTDWSSGNLCLRNRENGQIRALTDINGFQGKSFYFHPVWSRDDSFIACSKYRSWNELELYTINVQTKGKKRVYAGKNEKLYPQDWSPDNRKILCHVIFATPEKTDEELHLISLDGTRKKILDLGLYSRGMKFSPSGEAIAYDLLDDGRRHVYIHLLESGQNIRVTAGAASEMSFDSPRWSKDGRHLLYRYNRRNRYDLWAVPVSSGEPAGKPRLIHADIIQELLKMTGVDHTESSSRTHPPDISLPAPASFEDDFSTPVLDEAWSVFEWNQPNVYGYEDFGRFSLQDNSGHLRYYPGQITILGANSHYLPVFDSYWYWYYPALEISRTFRGEQWLLEYKVSYFSVPGMNSRSLYTTVFLNPNDSAGPNLQINRMLGSDQLQALVKLHSKGFTEPVWILKETETDHGYNFTCRFRIYRVSNLIRVDAALGDDEYETVLMTEVPVELLGKVQRLSFSGTSWYVPALTYADYDYVRLRPLKKSEARKIQDIFRQKGRNE